MWLKLFQFLSVSFFLDNVFLLETDQNTFYFIEVSWLSLCCFLEQQSFILDSCGHIVVENFPFPCVSILLLVDKLVWP